MKATIYRRCSTQEQTESGLGLAAQLAACEGAAARLGLTVAAVFDDAGVSGSTEGAEREGFMAAVATLEQGDVLLVAKRDRLGRDPIAVAMIERLVARKGARIVSAAGEGTEGNDPAAVLMRRMVDAFAEYERLLIGARTKAALAALKRSGVKLGGAALGWSRSEELDAAGRRVVVAVADEMRAVAAARAYRAEGLTLRAVAERLNAEGYAPKGGGRWHATTVNRACKAGAA